MWHHICASTDPSLPHGHERQGLPLARLCVPTQQMPPWLSFLRELSLGSEVSVNIFVDFLFKNLSTLPFLNLLDCSIIKMKIQSISHSQILHRSTGRSWNQIGPNWGMSQGGSLNTQKETGVTAVQWNKMMPQQPSNHHHIKNSWCLQWMSAFQAEILKKIKRSSGYCPSNGGKWLRKTKEKPHQLDRQDARVWSPHKLELPLIPSVWGQRTSPHPCKSRQTWRPSPAFGGQQKKHSAACSFQLLSKQVFLIKQKYIGVLFVCLEI